MAKRTHKKGAKKAHARKGRKHEKMGMLKAEKRIGKRKHGRKSKRSRKR